jgi:hypothetical protein
MKLFTYATSPYARKAQMALEFKGVVFEPIERSTGRVYDEPCHRLMGHTVDLPNTDWVAENHWCAPLYYRPAEVAAELQAVSG